MKVLVTGGMGFIGKAVVKRILRAGVDSILIIDNLSPKIHGKEPAAFDFNDKRVTFLQGDVSERNDIENLVTSADTLIHLAAETGTGQSMYEIEHYSKINISSVSLIFDILCNKKHNLKKIVLASSRAVYGEGKYLCRMHGDVYPLCRDKHDLDKGDFDVKCPLCKNPVEAVATSEDSVLHPVSFYGITKHFQESMVMNLSSALGIVPVALRYQNVYGPGQSLFNPYTGILSIFSNLIRGGKSINIFEDGSESRDFIFIDDVADVTANAAFSDEADGNIFNVGSGKPTSVLDIAKKLKGLFHSDVDIKINRNFRLGDIRHNFADLTKAKSLLGFSPKINLDDGLSAFINWVKSQELTENLYDSSINEMRSKGLYR